MCHSIRKMDKGFNIIVSKIGEQTFSQKKIHGQMSHGKILSTDIH